MKKLKVKCVCNKVTDKMSVEELLTHFEREQGLDQIIYFEREQGLDQIIYH